MSVVQVQLTGNFISYTLLVVGETAKIWLDCGLKGTDKVSTSTDLDCCV